MPPRKLTVQKRTTSETSISISKSTQIKPKLNLNAAMNNKSQNPSSSKLTKTKSIGPSSSSQNLPALNSTNNKLILNNNTMSNKQVPQVIIPQQQKKQPQMNDDKITNLLNRVLLFDKNEHSKRAMLLKSVKLFMSQKNPALTTPVIALFIDVFKSVFATAPPFSVITKSYRRIYFNPKEQYEDISVCYQLFDIVNTLQPTYPKELLHSLVKRLTSASIEDRNGAKQCLISVDDQYDAFILHTISLTLVPPPPHGVDALMEIVAGLLNVFDPAKIVDHFYMNDTQNVEATVLSELEETFRILHFAPHFQTFFQPLVNAMKAVIRYDPPYADESRNFIINYWPRLEPQKAVLFLQEATALCKDGPELDEYVWQRISWRASSIQWQIAMEGLNFIMETYQRAQGFNNDVLVFLLNDAVKTHWNSNVRSKAEEVLKLIQGKPLAPKTFPVDTWNMLKRQAESNYPKANFSGRKRVVRR